jgi:hypothetical protein
MDAKSIWISATARANYSTTHNLTMDTKKKKKYKIVNGKRVEDHSGLGLKKLGGLANKALKIITRTDGFNTYSKKDLENLRKKQNTTKGNFNKVNPLNKQNKKINEKKANITKENAGKTKAQIAALKRKRDGKTVASVNADNKKKMRDAARTRNDKFKKTGKSTVEERRAAAKKRMQDAARKRNEAFKNKRKLKVANKRKKKDKYAGISTI